MCATATGVVRPKQVRQDHLNRSGPEALALHTLPFVQTYSALPSGHSSRPNLPDTVTPVICNPPANHSTRLHHADVGIAAVALNAPASLQRLTKLAALWFRVLGDPNPARLAAATMLNQS